MPALFIEGDPVVPRKILYLQSTSEISGTDITLLRTVELLDRRRFEPHIVLHREGPFTEEYRRVGCQVHLLPSMRQMTFHRGIGYFVRCILGYPFAVAQIVSLIRREKINLVHTNTIHNPYGFLAALLSGKPHLWHIRELVVQSPFFRSLERGVVRCFSTRFIVMDNAIAEMFLKRGGGLPANIAKLYDGVDLEVFHPGVSGSRIRQELGIAEETPLIGMVGRLDPAKGPDLFIETAARVLKVRPDCRFWLCGGEVQGHEGFGKALRQKVERQGIQNQVFFTGWRYRFREIPEVYGALDICLTCPRYPEPYGLWCIEAMASGVPVVTFAQGGPAELCVGGETALFVSPGDTAAAAEAVLSLLRDPRQATRMGSAGRRRAEELFDRRRCVRELEELYETVFEETSKC
jgi:glycosyltransferase involved in cell wall biosynthesis